MGWRKVKKVNMSRSSVLQGCGGVLSSAVLTLTLSLAVFCSSCGKPAGQGSRPSVVAQLPFGAVDTPVAGQTLRGRVLVGGWALSEAGIRQVTIHIDRNFVAEATLGGPRPDVAKVHPGFPDSGTSGWNALLDTRVISEGPHELTVQARSKAGATRDLATIQVTIAR